MKKLTLSGLALALLTTLAWVIAAQTHVKQNAAAIAQQKCESPFYTRRAASGEENRFANDPVVQDFEVTRQVNRSALSEVVERGDKSLVPYLEYNADVQGDPGALLALIKLGDEARFSKLVNQTRCIEGDYDGSDHTRQSNAIELLARLKTPAAYRVLYSLLDDSTRPQSGGHVILFSRSETVIRELSGTVKPLPEGLDFPDGRGKSDAERLIIWKQWFKANNLIQ